MSEDNFSAIFDRLASVIGSGKPADIAKELEVTPQSMSHFKKTNKFPPDLIIKYCLKNNISLDWMFKGVGPAGVSGHQGGDIKDELTTKDHSAEYHTQNNANDEHVFAAIIGEMKHLHGKSLRKFLKYVLEELENGEQQS